MTKSPDAFRTISEVADWLGVQAHVLRFWESKFNQIKPVKRAGGRRYYRPSDMRLIGGIKKLLHDDGMTIKGVQKLLREQGVDHVSSLSPSLDETVASALAAAKGGPSVVVFQEKADAEDGQIELDIGAPGLTPANGPLDGAAETGAGGDAGEVAMPRDAETAAELERDSTLEEDTEQLAAELDPGAGGRLAQPANPASPTPAEAAPDDAEPVAEDPVEPAAEEPAEAEPAPGALPSFLRHRRDDMPPATPPSPTAEPAADEAAADALRARVVDAPDPPADHDIEIAAGLITRLTQQDALAPEQAQSLAPLVRELKSLHDRQVEAARLEFG